MSAMCFICGATQTRWRTSESSLQYEHRGAPNTIPLAIPGNIYKKSSVDSARKASVDCCLV